MKGAFQLDIHQPCHENWEAMTKEDKGRFCASCQKIVIDFSRMSDRELAAFFKKPSGSVCGRLRQDQLQRNIEIPRKRIPWIKYFFQFTLPALLFTARATAQGKVSARANTKTPVRTETRMHDSLLTTSSVGGKARQAAEEAKEFLKNEKLVLSAPPRVEEPLYREMIAGGISVTPRRHKQDKAIPLVQKPSGAKDQSLSVYPNPALPSSTMTIEWKEKEEGQLQVRLTNTAGQLVYSSEQKKEHKQNRFLIALPQLQQGIYILSVRNLKTGKNASKEIVIGQP